MFDASLISAFCFVLLFASAVSYCVAVGQLGGDAGCWAELERQQGGGPGLLGAALPDCDRLGRYRPKQCRGSKCYCVTPEGRRLEQYQMAPRERPLFCGQCTAGSQWPAPVCQCPSSCVIV